MPVMKQPRQPMRPLPRVVIHRQAIFSATWFSPVHNAVAGEVVCENARWYASIRLCDLPSASGKTARAAALAALDAWEAAQAQPAPVLAFADAPQPDCDAVPAAFTRRPCCDCGGAVEPERDSVQCARCADALPAPASPMFNHLTDMQRIFIANAIRAALDGENGTAVLFDAATDDVDYAATMNQIEDVADWFADGWTQDGPRPRDW